MFWIKLVFLLLTLGSLLISRIFYEDKSVITLKSNIFAIIAGIFGITFCIMVANTHWNVMLIPKILFFIAACVYVVFKEWDEECVESYIAIFIAVVAFIITGIIYIGHMEKASDPSVVTTSCNILCAKDGSTVTGSFSGSIIYVQGSSSEKSVYKYYYQQEDGGIKLASISADDTTIYILKEGEQPHIETVVTTSYYLNYNNNPATRCMENSEISYKLYVPEGSITNAYEFDAE